MLKVGSKDNLKEAIVNFHLSASAPGIVWYKKGKVIACQNFEEGKAVYLICSGFNNKPLQFFV